MDCLKHIWNYQNNLYNLCKVKNSDGNKLNKIAIKLRGQKVNVRNNWTYITLYWLLYLLRDNEEKHQGLTYSIPTVD